MAKYVNEKELLEEIKLSKIQDKLTPKAIELLRRMVKETNRTMRYKNYMDKQDCMARAELDVLLYWRSFNSDHPKANVFSYFTQMIKNGFAKGLNELYPEIREKITVVSISEEDGIYNI